MVTYLTSEKINSPAGENNKLCMEILIKNNKLVHEIGFDQKVKFVNFNMEPCYYPLMMDPK